MDDAIELTGLQPCITIRFGILREVRLVVLNSPVRAVAIALITAPLQMLAWSQQQKADPNVTPTIQVDVNVVNILATVRDREGKLINSLTKDDFILTDDGQSQQIKYFARETDMPLTIGLLVDVSGSQLQLIDIERGAAYQFLSQVLRKNDLAFLLSFGYSVELLQDFTGSTRMLQTALQRLHVGGLHSGILPTSPWQGTVLYDATCLAAAHLLLHGMGRKAMVLLTDGIDEGSRLTRGDAIKAAQQADTVIYSIYYVDRAVYCPPPTPSNSSNCSADVSDSALRKMSSETGGRVFHVNEKHPLPQAFDELQQEMRSQYSIGYAPTNRKRRSSYHHLGLRTRDRNLTVQARKGYYAIRSEK